MIYVDRKQSFRLFFTYLRVCIYMCQKQEHEDRQTLRTRGRKKERTRESARERRSRKRRESVDERVFISTLDLDLRSHAVHCSLCVRLNTLQLVSGLSLLFVSKMSCFVFRMLCFLVMAVSCFLVCETDYSIAHGIGNR